MDIERHVDALKRDLSLHLQGLLPPQYCNEMIARYDAARDGGRVEAVANQLIDQCRERLFNDELTTLLTRYFQGPVTLCWPRFDVVGSTALADDYKSALWHLDGGITGTHKLFIYLNPVAEHGGNTVMVDRERTDLLRQAGALPRGRNGRIEDVSEFFEEQGISPEVFGYDLNAGDGLLFDPVTLAHRCLLPREGRRRYTLCFTIVPGTPAIDGVRIE